MLNDAQRNEIERLAYDAGSSHEPSARAGLRMLFEYVDRLCEARVTQRKTEEMNDEHRALFARVKELSRKSEDP